MATRRLHMRTQTNAASRARSPAKRDRAERTHKHVQALTRGIVPIFFARLLQLDTSEPFEFEFNGKLITITIEDLPDADRRHHR